jgi:predicted O-methyltransferase YrrM
MYKGGNTMSIQALQEFLERHMASATAVASLAAALDARINGAPLDPGLADGIGDLLSSLGGGQVLDEVRPEEAAPLLGMIRALYMIDAKLLFPDTRTSTWNHAEPALLQAIGDGARGHAVGITRGVIPACAGLAERFRGSDARFLDIGVGVAGTAIAMAQMWPELSIVGIDPWQPSLKLARRNVEQAGLAQRIELREQRAEALEDRDVYDLAWLAVPFMPRQVIGPACQRTLQALRPGGWIIAAVVNPAAPSPMEAALRRLRMAQFGGGHWETESLRQLLVEAGYVDAQVLPAPPAAPAVMVVGRRPLQP